MQTLLRGIGQFQKQVFIQQRKLFQQLAEGQSPSTLFITCSDSRICPNLLTQTNPGELFTLRNAGNLVPPAESGCGGEAATIEYAIQVLKIPDIIVCGHSKCGAMGGLLNPDSLKALPQVRDWLIHARRTSDILTSQFQDLQTPADRLRKAVEINVLVQISHLLTYPYIRDAVEEGRLNLHGWVYHIESGEVDCWDQASESYLPLNLHEESLPGSH